MTWRNRQGMNPEQRFIEQEKEFGLENIQDIPIKTEQPSSGEDKSAMHFVDESGTLYFVLTAKGKRYRVQLAEF